jgi:DNA-binding NarL/FixJ family response regulator
VSQQPARILIVEDEEGLRRSLTVFLEDDGFEVIAAASAEEGLRLVIQCHPDTAIVDIRLPGMDGNTFIEQAHELNGGIGFIVYTGSDSYKPSLMLSSLGVTEEHVLKKPLIDMSVLVKAIRKQLASGGR